MEIGCSETVSARKKRVIGELFEGWESATQLKFMLQKPFGDGDSLTAKDLSEKIIRSFTETISVLSSSENGDEAGHRNLAVFGENGSPVVASSDDRRSEESSESRKRPSPQRPTKDRRGCYERRRNVRTWTTVTSNIEDGHAWRKYGQKEILNSKYPRSYYRCTRKKDQGCQAIKQVQRLQDNPEKYQTTYIGFHTCNNILNTPQMVTGTWESFPVNKSDSNLQIPEPDEQDIDQHPLNSSNVTVKQEYPKEETPSDTVADNLEDNNLWSQLEFEELSQPAIMPSKMASENADTVYSCTGSQTHLDIDFGVYSVCFHDFSFDDSVSLDFKEEK